jgi:S-DNA-T family DNA segregation ATPase FtsK/SpoIIIE
VSDAEVERVVSFLKVQGEPTYVSDLLEAFEAPEGGNEWIPDDAEGEDKLYRQAVEVVMRHRKASTSFVQRQLQLGYNRAARLVERMENEGLVSAPNHVGKRDILVEREDRRDYGELS